VILADDYQETWQRTGKYGSGQQEAALLAAFRSLVGIHSVLDVGCGIGRMRYLLGLAGYEGAYYGLDQEKVVISEAVRRYPHHSFVNVRIQDFPVAEPGWVDLVVATELLMHIPPTDLDGVVAKMFSLASKAVVTCDWAVGVPKGRTIQSHNWLHDYEAAFGDHIVSTLPAGPLQKVYILRP
jgi:trans-aconitate methyltransferase